MKKRSSLPPLTDEQRELVASALSKFNGNLMPLAMQCWPGLTVSAFRLGLTEAEIHSACLMGFTVAAISFDPALGFQFATYGSQWMRNELSKLVRSKIPKDGPRTINERRGRDDAEDTSPLRLIADPRPGPAAAAERADTREQAVRSLSCLSPREQRIVRARFGLGDQPEMTLEEIAVQENVTRERVRQIIAAAVERLRSVLIPLSERRAAASSSAPD